MKHFSLSQGQGCCALEADVSLSGGGISVYLCGGDAPHIGSVALAEPRNSLSGSGTSCTSSVLNLRGHKDEAFARPLAERLCRLSGLPVSVSAGVHVDQASQADIQRLQLVFEALSQEIILAVGEF